MRQRLDRERRGGELSAPREHEVTLEIGELKSEGAGQDLAAGRESPDELNGGYTNILSWEVRPGPVSQRSAGRGKNEPFERSSNLTPVTDRPPGPKRVTEIRCERRPCECGVFSVERNGENVGEGSPRTKGDELIGEMYRGTIAHVHTYRVEPSADYAAPRLVLGMRGV